MKAPLLSIVVNGKHGKIALDMHTAAGRRRLSTSLRRLADQVDGIVEYRRPRKRKP